MTYAIRDWWWSYLSKTKTFYFRVLIWGEKKWFTDEGMFSSNLISFISWIVSWLEVWPNTQIKMKELPVISIAPLSRPCKTMNTCSLVLVILGVYHVKRNSSYCMITPSGEETPYRGITDLCLHHLSVLGCLWLSPSMLPRVHCHDVAFGVHAIGLWCLHTRVHTYKQRPGCSIAIPIPYASSTTVPSQLPPPPT